MHIAITTNGPGEFSGWVRPLVAALYRLAPQTAVTIFFVPDDYATGRESDVARGLFPQARIVSASEYRAFFFGRNVVARYGPADVVQYLGGDLFHHALVARRLGGSARTYKFTRRRGHGIDRIYAVDAKNAADLERVGVAAERIQIVGNLAIDGARAEADGLFGDPGGAVMPPSGLLMMPGTRRHEIANIVPFFLAIAEFIRLRRPSIPIGFALSPFTQLDEVERALAHGGHRNIWSSRGRVVDGRAIEGRDGMQFPILRDAMRSAAHAMIAVTLPGTKCIELASLGVPTIVCAPANAPEVVVINGPLQYLDRIPKIGILLKREIVTRVDRRFRFVAQPNIDLDAMVMPEMRGALMAGEVARKILAYADDSAARADASRRLRALYADHAGAAERMALSILAGASA